MRVGGFGCVWVCIGVCGCVGVCVCVCVCGGGGEGEERGRGEGDGFCISVWLSRNNVEG